MTLPPSVPTASHAAHLIQGLAHTPSPMGPALRTSVGWAAIRQAGVIWSQPPPPSAGCQSGPPLQPLPAGPHPQSSLLCDPAADGPVSVSVSSSRRWRSSCLVPGRSSRTTQAGHGVLSHPLSATAHAGSPCPHTALWAEIQDPNREVKMGCLERSPSRS